MAVMVLSLGVVSVWAGGRGKPAVPVPQPPGKPGSNVAAKYSASRHGSSATPKPAREGLDFQNSSMFGGRVFPDQCLFRWINPGTFQMGSTQGTDPDRSADEVRHEVTLTRGFWILDHEVTQWEYKIVMRSNPSRHRDDWLPVESMNWDEAVEFCRKLTEMDRQKGLISAKEEYRLPTEAEWEYAARAGTTGARYTVEGRNVADSLNLIAWHSGNSGLHSHFVMNRFRNPWGLFDMLGNVSEWCSDWYGDYPTGNVTDPTGPSSGRSRVARGGSYNGDASWARSAARIFSLGLRYVDVGFRPVLSAVR